MKRSHRELRSTALSSGVIAILLGLVSYLLARGRDGFDKGLLTGMTVALMVIGAYLLGSGARPGRRARANRMSSGYPARGDGGEGLWLPSRDDQE